MRRFYWSVLLSVLLHVAVLLSPWLHLPVLGPDKNLPPLQAYLHSPAPVPARPQVHDAPSPEPPRRPEQAPPAPHQVAETPPAQEPVPEPAPTPLPPPQESPTAAVNAPLGPSDILSSTEHGQIVFNVTMGKQGLVVGRSTHTWQRQQERYQLSSVTETVGLVALFRNTKVTQESQGRLGRQGLQPELFVQIRDRDDGVRAEFDWNGRQLRLNGAPAASDLDADAQDLLSFIYQLVLRHPQHRSFLHVTTGRAYNRYELDYLGVEPLYVAGQEYRVWHDVTIAPPGEQSTDVWLAPELAFLPVRIRFTDRKGDRFDMLAQVLNFGPHQLSASGSH